MPTPCILQLTRPLLYCSLQRSCKNTWLPFKVLSLYSMRTKAKNAKFKKIHTNLQSIQTMQNLRERCPEPLKWQQEENLTKTWETVILAERDVAAAWGRNWELAGNPSSPQPVENFQYFLKNIWQKYFFLFFSASTVKQPIFSLRPIISSILKVLKSFQLEMLYCEL